MVTPPAERPPMPKGTLLRFRRKGKLFSKPPHDVLGKCDKEESIMSLGEFVASGSKTFIKVMTRLGISWVRIGEVDIYKDSSDFTPFVVLTLEEACFLQVVVKHAMEGHLPGEMTGEEQLLVDSAFKKIQAINDMVPPSQKVNF